MSELESVFCSGGVEGGIEVCLTRGVVGQATYDLLEIC